MHSTKTLILTALAVALAMLAAGYALRGDDDVDNSEPSPSVSASPSDVSAGGPARSPVLHTVRLTAGVPVPSTLIIRTGDAVTLTNDSDRLFWPKSDACAGFDALRGLAAGEHYTLTFNTRVTCTYHDHLDPHAVDRTGTIIVQ